MGKSSINGPFSMAMLNNQRVLNLILQYSRQTGSWLERCPCPMKTNRSGSNLYLPLSDGPYCGCSQKLLNVANGLAHESKPHPRNRGYILSLGRGSGHWILREMKLGARPLHGQPGRGKQKQGHQILVGGFNHLKNLSQ